MDKRQQQVNDSIARLQAQSGKLDVQRTLSFAPKSGAKNLVEEGAKALQVSWRITNNSSNNAHLILGAYIGKTGVRIVNNTLYPSSTEILALASATGVLIDGTVYTDVTAESLDSAHSIEEFIRHFSKNPTRVVKAAFKSKVSSTGEKDSSNYDNKLKTIWTTPFDVPQVRELSLRALQAGGNNFNPDMLDVDFQKLNFPVVLSDEHFLQVQVNPDTVLTVTMFIGAHDSKAQRFYRQMKAADDVMRAEFMMNK